MHMVHLSGHTSVVSKSSSDWLNYTGFPGDVCVAFFNVPPGNKVAPSRKKKAVVFTNVTANTYQGRLNAGFSKVCEIFKVCTIESLKYIREFHTLFVIMVTFPRPETWRWMKQPVIGCLTCQSHGRALTNECSHIFQIFSRQSLYGSAFWTLSSNLTW